MSYIYPIIILLMLLGGWYGKTLVDDSWEGKIKEANAKIKTAEALASTQAIKGEKTVEVRFVRLEPNIEAVRESARGLELSPAAIDVYCSIGVLNPVDCARLQSRPASGSTKTDN